MRCTCLISASSESTRIAKKSFSQITHRYLREERIIQFRSRDTLSPRHPFKKFRSLCHSTKTFTGTLMNLNLWQVSSESSMSLTHNRSSQTHTHFTLWIHLKLLLCWREVTRQIWSRQKPSLFSVSSSLVSLSKKQGEASCARTFNALTLRDIFLWTQRKRLRHGGALTARSALLSWLEMNFSTKLARLMRQKMF